MRAGCIVKIEAGESKIYYRKVSNCRPAYSPTGMGILSGGSRFTTTVADYILFLFSLTFVMSYKFEVGRQKQRIIRSMKGLTASAG